MNAIESLIILIVLESGKTKTNQAVPTMSLKSSDSNLSAYRYSQGLSRSSDPNIN